MDTIRFDAPGEYVISVQGIVSQGLYDMIRDVIITVKDDEKVPVSDIHLKVKDQAHLVGIINMLYDWHHVILNVTKISAQKTREQVII